MKNLNSRAMWKWVDWWTSWAPVPNKPTVSVDVKQHFNNNMKNVIVGATPLKPGDAEKPSQDRRAATETEMGGSSGSG